MDPRESDNEQVESGNPKTESKRDSVGQTAVAVAVEERAPQQRKIARTNSDLQSLILVPSLWIINIKTEEKNWEREGKKSRWKWNPNWIWKGENEKRREEKKEGDEWDNKMWRAWIWVDGFGIYKLKIKNKNKKNK